MSEDLIEHVRAQVADALSKACTEAEGIRFSVTWQPIQTPQGSAVMWHFLFTAPSCQIGAVPIGATTDPIITRSLPAPSVVAEMAKQAVAGLRQAQGQEKAQILHAGARLNARIN